MKKIKKWAILFLIPGIISFTPLLLFGQEIQSRLDIKRDAVEKKTIEEDIQNLQSQVVELLKKLKLENQDEITTDIGAKHTQGNKKKFVYTKKIITKISGNNLSEIRFILDMSSEATIFHETRELENKNPGDKNHEDLKVIYMNSKGEREEVVLKSVEENRQKIRILREYRDNLSEFIRWMNFFASKGNNDQNKKIKRALRVGDV